MNNKKGELTTNQIISIIILIVSFAVILLFFFMLNLKSNIDTESCRNSVVLRSSIPGGVTAVQLQCKTQTVCVYKSEDCENLGKDVIKIKAVNKAEILDVLTDRIYGCHWQMGGGKLDFLPSSWGTTNYCAICDRIYFDRAIMEDSELNTLPVKEVYTTLKSKKTDTGNTLLFDMYGLNSLESISVQDNDGKTIDILNQNYDLSRKEGYVLVTSMAKKGWASTVLSAAGGIVIGAIALTASPITGGASLVAGGALLAGGVTGGVGFVVSGPGGTEYLPPSLYLNRAEIVKTQLKCEDFTTLA